MKMKIAIKKKYLARISFYISIVLGLSFIQELLRKISQRSLSTLIVPLIFLFSTIYAVNYLLGLRFKEKLAEEISKQVAKGNPQKAEQIKKHLWNKSQEEAYTLNFFMGKIIFTSSWIKQDKLEKLKSEHIPDIIKEEFIKRAKK